MYVYLVEPSKIELLSRRLPSIQIVQASVSYYLRLLPDVPRQPSEPAMKDTKDKLLTNSQHLIITTGSREEPST